MRLLIDTECWLWSLTDFLRLNVKARSIIANRHNTIYLSSASSWEISIKCALGRLTLPEPPGKYIPSRMSAQDIRALPIEHVHALQVFSLPLHHRDPFDRILIAQAQVESLAVLTTDRAFKAYDVELIWAGRRS